MYQRGLPPDLLLRTLLSSAHSHLSKDCTENASTTMTPFILKVLKPLNSGNFDFLPAACNWFVFVSIFREKMSSVQNFDWLFRAVGGFHPTAQGWESYSRGGWTSVVCEPVWYVNQCGMWTSGRWTMWYVEFTLWSSGRVWTIITIHRNLRKFVQSWKEPSSLKSLVFISSNDSKLLIRWWGRGRWGC